MPARYDMGQILCEFPVQVMKRFKGLEIDNTMPEELWTAVCNIVQEVVNKTSLKKPRGKVFMRRFYR